MSRMFQKTVLRRSFLHVGRTPESGATVSENGLGARATHRSPTAGWDCAVVCCLRLRGLSTAQEHPANSKVRRVGGGLTGHQQIFASKKIKEWSR